MFCTKCGAKIDDNYLFCPSCGARRTDTQAARPDSVNVPRTPSPAPAPASAYPAAPTPAYEPVKAVQPQAKDPSIEEQLERVFGPQEEEPMTVPLGHTSPEKEDKAQEPVQQTMLADEGYTDSAPEASQAEVPAEEESDDSRTVLLPNAGPKKPEPVQTPYEKPASAAYPTPSPVYRPEPEPAKPYGYEYRAPAAPANDGFRQDRGYGDGWQQNKAPYGAAAPAPMNRAQQAAVPQTAPAKEPKQKKVYKKTSGGIRVLSIFLCLVMFFFGSLAFLTTGLHLGWCESNIRNACHEGSLADLVITTSEGEKTLVDIIVESAAQTNTTTGKKPVQLDSLKVRRILEKTSVESFLENVLVDYQQYFLMGRTPFKLNADAIGNFLYELSDEIRFEVGYVLTPSDIDSVKNRINGGDLSFLSIDASGGYFYRHYQIDPQILALPLSVWVMVVLLVLTVLFIVLIFLVNRKNLPAGMSFNGVTLTILGAFYSLIAIGVLVLSLVKNIYLVSALIRYLALGFGILGVIALVIGIVLIVLKSVLKKKSVTQ